MLPKARASRATLDCRIDSVQCRTLVDTGTDVSLVWSGLLPNTGQKKHTGWDATTAMLASVTGANTRMQAVNGVTVEHDVWHADILEPYWVWTR